MSRLKLGSKKLSPGGFTNLLPDDRPITAISVVEDIDKCPPNFTVVSSNKIKLKKKKILILKILF